jgi:NhaA family Na+:H+ antiporter
MSDKTSKLFKKSRFRLIYAPWQKSFDRMLTPFERFVKHQATAGLLLMFTAFIALVLANSALSESYQHLLHVSAGFNFGSWQLEKSLHHWINDGLMTLFFFIVGLELKREILVGELANLKMAILPVAAAIGGMVAPALIYLTINPSGDVSRGWGIPMATDIAFALGVIALLADRVPKALITFLVALAIVDDLGAVVVIALFYTEQLMLQYLVIGGILIGVMVIMNLVGIRHPLPYFIFGILLWFAMLKSGVHATLAGVITAFSIPALPKFDPKSFSVRMRHLLDSFDESYEPGESILKNQDMAAVVQALEKGVQGVETPLQRLEHSMHMPVAFLVLPLFALFNAGIQIDFSNLASSLSEPVTLGVSVGLLLGKFIGIVGFSWLAIRLGLSALPADVRMAHICGAALLGSIGFTMSIFVAELAFVQHPEMIAQAKLGILAASVFAGVVGYICLYHLGKVDSSEVPSS